MCIKHRMEKLHTHKLTRKIFIVQINDAEVRSRLCAVFVLGGQLIALLHEVL